MSLKNNNEYDGILITGGAIIDPAADRIEAGDLLISQGVIAGSAPPGEGSALLDRAGLARETVLEIDASGKAVSPGFVDIHVHLREPGFEEKETVASGAAAAVAGGFTSVACMPNTEPVIDSQETVSFILERAKRAGLARVYPIGAVSGGRKGRELSEMWFMKQAGAVAFSDDGTAVATSELFWRALEYAGQLGLPVIEHAEDAGLARRGVMHEGSVSTELGLKGIPSSAEEIIVARDLILLGEAAEGRLHIAHISTRGAVEQVRAAKKAGLPVTCEVTPHHIALTHESLRHYNSDFKMNPPLRPEKDRKALIDALCDGTIDCIATDHAPHRMDEKEVELESAPFGVIGLETALGVCIDVLVSPGRMNLPGLVNRLSTVPAGILGVPGGDLVEGVPADVTIFDADEEWTVKPETFHGKSENSAFRGRKLRGRVVHTIVGGRLVFSEGEIFPRNDA